MNDIPDKQNTKASLDLLAAQRQSYADAKTVLAAQVFVLLAVPVASAIAVAIDPDLRVWGAFAGLVLALLDASVLDPWQKACRDRGAGTQELFDCSVLSMTWNPWVGGTEPDREDVHAAASRFDERNPKGREQLRDWYPTKVASLPLHLARVICQRANCKWDSKLRRYYSNAVMLAVAAVSVAVVALGLLRDMSLEHVVLAMLAPLTPALLWAIREVVRQNEAVRSADKLKDRGTAFWERAKRELGEAACGSESRQFQDAIFLHRRKSPFVFDWFYWLFKNRFEKQMYASAEQMISEVTREAR